MKKFYNRDCIEVLRELPDNSVQLFLEDMPYNTTQNNYEYEVNLIEYWRERKRVMKPNAVFALWGVNPFSASLITSNPKWFKYDYSWIKSHKTNFLNCKKMPLREKEDILIFYDKQPIYNPQLSPKDPRNKRPIPKNYRNSETLYCNFKEGNHRTIPEDMDYPSQAIYCPNPSKTDTWHPSQKPQRVLRFLIRTYTNPGDLVFDGFAGSGTTGLACISEDRNFIICEHMKEHFDKSEPKIKHALSEPTLFSLAEPQKRAKPIQTQIEL